MRRFFGRDDDDDADSKRKRGLAEAAINAFNDSDDKKNKKDGDKASSPVPPLAQDFSQSGNADDHAVASGGAGQAGVKFGYKQSDLKDPKKIIKLVDRMIVEAVKHQNWDQIWVYKNDGKGIDANLSKYIAERAQVAASVMLADVNKIDKKADREFVKGIQKSFKSLGLYDGHQHEYVQRMTRLHVNFNAQPAGHRPCDVGFFQQFFSDKGPARPSV